MRRLKLTLILLIVALSIAISCNDTTPPEATPGGGFLIQTLVNENGIVFTAAGVAVLGKWQKDLPGAAGDPSQFTQITNSEGLAAVVGGRAPANWQFTWLSASGEGSVCDGFSASGDIALNQISDFTCITANFIGFVAASAISVSPNPINTTSPPNSITVTGQGFSTTYGMPLLQYFALDGTLVAQETATSVSGGTSMQVSGGGISQMPVGTYAGYVSNAGPNGSWNYVGTAGLQVADGWVTIGGPGEQTITSCRPGCSPSCSVYCVLTIYDNGTVGITVNGFPKTVSYGNLSNFASIASDLAGAFNNDPNSPVIASTNGPVVLFARKNRSASYSFSTAVSYDYTHFSHPSFTAAPSGPTM